MSDKISDKPLKPIPKITKDEFMKSLRKVSRKSSANASMKKVKEK